jgi:uncharacterized protein with ACT and thioredoxin-like domain
MSVLIADNGTNLSLAQSSIKGKVETIEVDVSKIEDFEKLKSKIEKDLDGSFPSLPLSTSSLKFENKS